VSSFLTAHQHIRGHSLAFSALHVLSKNNDVEKK